MELKANARKGLFLILASLGLLLVGMLSILISRQSDSPRSSSFLDSDYSMPRSKGEISLFRLNNREVSRQIYEDQQTNAGDGVKEQIPPAIQLAPGLSVAAKNAKGNKSKAAAPIAPVLAPLPPLIGTNPSGQIPSPEFVQPRETEQQEVMAPGQLRSSGIAANSGLIKSQNESKDKSEKEREKNSTNPMANHRDSSISSADEIKAFVIRESLRSQLRAAPDSATFKAVELALNEGYLSDGDFAELMLEMLVTGPAPAVAMAQATLLNHQSINVLETILKHYLETSNERIKEVLVQFSQLTNSPLLSIALMNHLAAKPPETRALSLLVDLIANRLNRILTSTSSGANSDVALIQSQALGLSSVTLPALKRLLLLRDPLSTGQSSTELSDAQTKARTLVQALEQYFVRN